MNRICATRIICAPPTGTLLGDTLDADFPVNNLSAEKDDGTEFPSLFFPTRPLPNPLGPDPHGIDNSVPDYWAPGCLGLCQATSQELADLCAQAQAFLCAHTPPDGPPPAFFISNSASCTLLCPDGSPFVFIVPPGTFVSGDQITADQLAINYACFRGAQLLMCMGDLASGCAGQSYSGSITVNGGVGPFQIKIFSGDLPQGMGGLQVGNTFQITGTAPAAGVYDFTMEVADSQGNLMHRTYHWHVFGITNINSIPDAELGVAYPSFTFTVAGGTAPYKFDIVVSGSESFPNGLQIDPNTGEFFGTASNTPIDTYNFRVRLKDSAGQECTFPAHITVKESCGDSADWYNAPGLCRLRISGYTPASLLNCPACFPSINTAWDGTFPVFHAVGVEGPFPAYRADMTSNKSVAGSLLDGSTGLFWDGTGWMLQIACSAGAMWQSAVAAGLHPGSPLGVYTLVTSCPLVGQPATLTIEGFIPP